MIQHNKLFLELFKSRKDRVLKYNGAKPVSEEVNGEDDILNRLDLHFEGKQRIGFYNKADDNKVNWAVVEFEDHGSQTALEPLGWALKYQKLLIQAGIHSYLERSKSNGGNSYHLWIFFNEPIDAAYAHDILLALAKTIDNGFNPEVFPKSGSEGIGNPVWLPLFGGTDSGGLGIDKDRTVFIDEQGQPFGDQWAILENVIKASMADLQKLESCYNICPTKSSAVIGRDDSAPAGKLSRDNNSADLESIREHCPAIDEAFKSIESDGNSGSTGHNMRLAVASMIKHTIDDEQYLLDLFGNLADFDVTTTLTHYRSINKDPITCLKLQEWGLCPGKCQLMQDLDKRSPIAFGYRHGFQLLTNDELFQNAKDDDHVEELLKRAKMMTKPIAQAKLINRIHVESALAKGILEEQLKQIKVYDEEKPYLVNGEIDNVKAAEYIIKRHSLMRYKEDFYRYEEGLWSAMEDEEVESIIHHEIKKHSNNYIISEVISAAMREAYLNERVVEGNRDKYIIATANGLLDVRTGGFRGFEKEDYIFKKMKASYIPSAKCIGFMNFLDDLFRHDSDSGQKKLFSQELFGYLLIPDYTLVKKMFYFYGRKADNGKSSLLEIFRAVIGDGYFTSVPLNKLDTTMTGKLYRRHANIVGDQSAHTLVPDGIVKQLVGGHDWLTVDRKYKEAIEFVNTARLIFAVNKLPYSEAKDNGYFTRTEILVFNNQFIVNPDPTDNRQMLADTNKIEEIKKNELDGILNWGLEGLNRLLVNGKMTEVPSSKEEIDKYRMENNSIAMFVDDACKLVAMAEVDRSELYTNYKNWCIKHGYKNPVKATTFYATLENEHKVTQKHYSTHRSLVGIRTI